jgi:hypothetical protein
MHTNNRLMTLPGLKFGEVRSPRARHRLSHRGRLVSRALGAATARSGKDRRICNLQGRRYRHRRHRQFGGSARTLCNPSCDLYCETRNSIG